jgi:hypothetical protein
LNAEQFAAWLGHVLSDFEPIESSLPTLRFYRVEGGDTYGLTASIENSSIGSRMAVELTVSPD